MIAYMRRKRRNRPPFDFSDEQFLAHNDLLDIVYDEIRFRNGTAYANDVDLSTVDAMFFRSVGREYDIVSRLVDIAIANNIPVVDEYLLDKAFDRSKEHMADVLAEHNINHPPHISLMGLEGIAYNTSDRFTYAPWFEYPVIAKFSTGGRGGYGTFFIQEQHDFIRVTELLNDRFAARHERDEDDVPWHAYGGDWPFVIQQYIPNEGDYRAVVVGYECIGITKRRSKNGHLVMCTSEGNSRRFKNNRWPRDVGAVAEQAARAMKVQFAGVDLVRHSETGEIYVIEVNEAPSFKFFQKRTKIPVASVVVDYIRGLTNG